MEKITSLLAVAVAGIGFQSAAAALVITPTTNGTALASNLTGSGITTSNISLVGLSGQAGTFTGGIAAGIGFESGIILSTGTVTDASNTSAFDADTSMGWGASDAMLTSLFRYNTNDASSLSFDFQSSSSSIFFTFVFASEEYPEYIGQPNDAFAIFLDGQNIATLPNTSTAVTINNINSGANSTYYVDNGSGTYLNVFDGFTTPIQVSFNGLTSGMHTLKFAVADTQNELLDSAVFIEAGSLSSSLTSSSAVPEPAQVAASMLLLAGIGGYVFLKRRKATKAAAPALA